MDRPAGALQHIFIRRAGRGAGGKAPNSALALAPKPPRSRRARERADRWRSDGDGAAERAAVRSREAAGRFGADEARCVSTGGPCFGEHRDLARARRSRARSSSASSQPRTTRSNPSCTAPRGRSDSFIGRSLRQKRSRSSVVTRQGPRGSRFWSDAMMPARSRSCEARRPVIRPRAIPSLCRLRRRSDFRTASGRSARTVFGRTPTPPIRTSKTRAC